MGKNHKFQVFCHFSAIAQKTIIAESFAEAKQIAESDYSVQLEKIVRLTEPCRVDESMSHEVNEHDSGDQHVVDYQNWGAE